MPEWMSLVVAPPVDLMQVAVSNAFTHLWNNHKHAKLNINRNIFKDYQS